MMTRDPLSEALRSLPREKASEGFTERVMRQLDEPAARHTSPWIRPLLVAAALATLVVGVFLTQPTKPPATNDRNARLEALETERERLERELAEIRSLAEQAPPREIYLGGNDQVEVFLDVGWSAVQRADRGSGRSTITPASYPMNRNTGI